MIHTQRYADVLTLSIYRQSCRSSPYCGSHCWILAGRARHSLTGLHQYYAHNCTHDVHGAGGEAHLGACRIEYEVQPKERDPEAASCHQFCHLTAHTGFPLICRSRVFDRCRCRPDDTCPHDRCRSPSARRLRQPRERHSSRESDNSPRASRNVGFRRYFGLCRSFTTQYVAGASPMSGSGNFNSFAPTSTNRH